MAVAASLSDNVITVEPGGECACDVLIRNTGDVVDQFSVDVLGDAREWTEVNPAIINLLPGGESTAHVTFRPPRTPEVPAGTTPFAIRVLSREDEEGSTVEEGEVEVVPFTQVTAELVPAKRRGRRWARFRLVVDNTGNHDTPAEIMVVDPEDDIAIRVRPPTVTIRPGTAVVVQLKVVPHKRFLKGAARTLPFRTMVLLAGEDDIETDGVMIQEQLMPAWLLPALAFLAVIGGALVALWFLLLRPQVQSIAKQEAQQQVAPVAAQASQAASQASEVAKAAGVGGGTGGGSGAKNGSGGGNSASPAGTGANPPGGTGSAGTGTAGASPPGTGGTNDTDFRIATAANPVTNGSFQTFAFTEPNHQPLDITDLVFQNPRGDSGILRVLFGSNVVLEEGLDNFRDLDYHYVVPLHVNPDQPVVVAVDCVTPGPGATQCTPSVSFSGKAGS